MLTSYTVAGTPAGTLKDVIQQITLIFPSQTHRRQRKLDLRLSFNHYILKPIFVSSVKHLDTM